MNEKDPFSLEEYAALREQKVDEYFYDFFKMFKEDDFSQLFELNQTQIILNEKYNIPIYYEVRKDVILIQIGKKEYFIETIKENLDTTVLIKTKVGKTTVLYEEKYEESEFKMPLSPKARAGAYWLRESAGIKGQTGGWLKVLSIAADAGSIIGTVTGNALFGIGSIILSVGIKVGESFYQTLWTKKYQSLRSDCKTYVRERIDFYQYNDYHGFIKRHYNYFHSSRPDYAGGSCTNY